jgi:hypothetical protein
MGRYGLGMGLLASPTLGLCRERTWTHPRPIPTANIYGIGMRLAPSPTRSQDRKSVTDLVGDGTSPIPVPYCLSELDGNWSRPIPDKVLRAGIPIAPSPTHTDPFLNPGRRAFTTYFSTENHPLLKKIWEMGNEGMNITSRTSRNVLRESVIWISHRLQQA